MAAIYWISSPSKASRIPLRFSLEIQDVSAESFVIRVFNSIWRIDIQCILNNQNNSVFNSINCICFWNTINTYTPLKEGVLIPVSGSWSRDVNKSSPLIEPNFHPFPEVHNSYGYSTSPDYNNTYTHAYIILHKGYYVALQLS